MTHHAGSDEGLSEAEQRALLRHIRLPDGNCTCDGMSRQLPHLIATVERILTARAAAPDALRERLLAWIDDQRQLLPEHRTPAAHAKAELLRDLRATLADPTDGATT